MHCLLNRAMVVVAQASSGGWLGGGTKVLTHPVGLGVGFAVGLAVGDTEGDTVGEAVGLSVGL